MLNRIMLVTGCGLNEMPVNFGRVVAETVLIVTSGPIFIEWEDIQYIYFFSLRVDVLDVSNI